MSHYTFETISKIINGKVLQNFDPEVVISSLGYDTRTLTNPDHTLFFAIKTSHNDGHHYLLDAYDKGVRNFVIETIPVDLPGANILQTESSISALQTLAFQHRNEFNIPVVGIAGSNG